MVSRVAAQLLLVLGGCGGRVDHDVEGALPDGSSRDTTSDDSSTAFDSLMTDTRIGSARPDAPKAGERPPRGGASCVDEGAGCGPAAICDRETGWCCAGTILPTRCACGDELGCVEGETCCADSKKRVCRSGEGCR